MPGLPRSIVAAEIGMLAGDRAQQAGLADAVAAEHAGHLARLGVSETPRSACAAP
jgi:hypothetical protein